MVLYDIIYYLIRAALSAYRGWGLEDDDFYLRISKKYSGVVSVYILYFFQTATANDLNAINTK